MKCKDCLSSKCKYAAEFGEGDCWYESNLPSDSWFFKLHKEKRNTDFDWQSFRNQAAKDILCAMIAKFGTSDIDMNDVVKWADSLISKLKEKEN